MSRLLSGTPVRSDGKLTVVSLAVEAGVKRYLLTHKFTDLKDEFYGKVQASKRAGDHTAGTDERIKDLEQSKKELEATLREQEEREAGLVRELHLLVLENEELRKKHGAITPIQRR